MFILEELQDILASKAEDNGKTHSAYAETEENLFDENNPIVRDLKEIGKKIEECVDHCIDSADNFVDESLEKLTPAINCIRETKAGEEFLDNISDKIGKFVEFLEKIK